MEDFSDRRVRVALAAMAFVASAMAAAPGRAALIPSPDGVTVYDTVNNITWLAAANFSATNRFGLPVRTGSGSRAQRVSMSAAR